MPSPTWRAAYSRLINSVPQDIPIRHWGDVDEGGFRIAALIAADLRALGRTLTPYRMHPDDIAESDRRPASDALAIRMSNYARNAGWEELARDLLTAKFTVEQEGL